MYQVVVYKVNCSNENYSYIAGIFDNYSEANKFADEWYYSNDEVAVVSKL